MSLQLKVLTDLHWEAGAVRTSISGGDEDIHAMHTRPTDTQGDAVVGDGRSQSPYLQVLVAVIQGGCCAIAPSLSVEVKRTTTPGWFGT